MSEDSQIAYGINPVFEILKNEISVSKLIILKNKANPRIEKIIFICKEKHIQFRFEDRSYFDQILPGKLHQGIIAYLKKGVHVLTDITEYLDKLKIQKKRPTVAILDQITDPHNIGAICRSAYFFGIDLIIIEKNNSAPLGGTVHKISSGASLLLKFYLSDKLASDIAILQDQGFLIYSTGFSDKCISVKDIPVDTPVAFILGSEGKGVRKHLERASDNQVIIPGINQFNSLNVSNAAAVLFYEIQRQSI